MNRSYQELAAHYGTAIVPARVRKPKDKNHAEAAVRMAGTWILAALRNQKFFILSEMREAVAERLEDLNTRAFTNRSGNRKTAFLEEELQYMLPLPKTPYYHIVPQICYHTMPINFIIIANVYFFHEVL